MEPCGEYSPSVTDDVPMVESTPPEKSKMKGLKPGLWLGLMGLVLVVGIVFLCVMMIFGGPLTDITMAYSDLMESESFTAEITSGDTTAVAMVNVNLQERHLTVHLEDEGKYRMVIYNGFFILSMGGHDYRTDISERLNEFYDEYEDWDLDEIDWEELLKTITPGFYEEVQKRVDFEALDDCLTAYFMTANDKDWLEENAGFSVQQQKDVTYYVFEPNLYDFCYASAREFEDAFVTSDDYDAFVKGLEKEESRLDALPVKIRIGLESGELVSTEILAQEISTTIKFTDVGKTEMDTDALEGILATSEEMTPFLENLFKDYIYS